MNAFLHVAIFLVGGLGVLNLLLSLAIVRRLKAAETSGVWRPDDQDMPQPGTVVGSFSVTTVDGNSLDDDEIRQGERFVALLRAGCEPCRTFVDRVLSRTLAIPQGAVLLVVQDTTSPAYVDRLRSYAHIVTTSPDSAGVLAFGPIAAYPTFLHLDRGVIVAADYRAERLLAGFAARSYHDAR